MLIILIRDISRHIGRITTRRRSLIPGQSRQGIGKTRCGGFEVFHQSFSIVAGICIMTAGSKFSFKSPGRLSRSVNARNCIHQFRQGRNGILQTKVHTPQDTGVRFVTKSRSFCSCALALIQSCNTKDRASAQTIQIQGQFRTSTKQKLVIDFEQRFAFEGNLDFLVGIQSTFTEKFNLSQFIVHFVVRTANKGSRTGGHLFGTGRNIHTGTTIHSIAGAGIADT